VGESCNTTDAVTLIALLLAVLVVVTLVPLVSGLYQYRQLASLSTDCTILSAADSDNTSGGNRAKSSSSKPVVVK
jgi:hypothetical protein